MNVLRELSTVIARWRLQRASRIVAATMLPSSGTGRVPDALALAMQLGVTF